MVYDLVVVGAGIAGCAVAYFAKQRGVKVLIVDRASTPATGGSGAAGAFISPKLGKESKLLNLTNLSYKFATNFYATNFKNYFTQSGIVRIAKDLKDEQNLKYYQSIIDDESKILNLQELKRLNITSTNRALYFKSGGVCDAQGLCKALIKGVEFKQIDVKSIKNCDGFLLINYKIKAKNITLATGFEGFNNYLDYMGISGIWGSRGDFFSSCDLKVSMHKNISISSNIDGTIKIGATHIRGSNACLKCNGEPLKPLLNEAKNMINCNDLKLKETFCGMRSGSRDYFPVVGKIIDTQYMLTNYPQIKKGFSKVKLKYIDNIYVLNGLGGRGFVFAPLMAKWLIEHIFDGKEIDDLVNPNRLFLKWARRLK